MFLLKLLHTNDPDLLSSAQVIGWKLFCLTHHTQTNSHTYINNIPRCLFIRFLLFDP